MGATTESAPADAAAGIAVRAFLRRLWRWLWPPTPESAPAIETEAQDLTLTGRLRKFLWLSSGLFSAASLAIPVLGYVVFGAFDGMATNFVAAVASAALFGLASLLHFGPEAA